jgi:acyl carrier protein
MLVMYLVNGHFHSGRCARCAVVVIWIATAAREKNGMTPAEIREEVLDILRDITPDEDLSQLDDSVRFREQLELDSMDFLDIVMELRKRHRIQIPEEDYIQLASMNSTVAYLEPLMRDIEREKV